MQLKVPSRARPVSEKVRQAIFSSLATRVLDAKVLDLYCGSGAYGLEALSRGASCATFVDGDLKAIDVCKANAEHVGFENDARMRRMEAERYLRQRGPDDGPFDLVFADPPYDTGPPLDRLLGAMARSLDPEGLVVVETRWSQDAPPEAEWYSLEADRRYGDTRVLTFSARANREGR